MNDPGEQTLEVDGVTLTVTRSAEDGAVVLFIDTDFEPSGSDGSPGLRVWLNEHLVDSGDGR